MDQFKTATKIIEVGNVDPRFPDIVDVQINDVSSNRFTNPVPGL